jgi:hypothetical protein
MYSSLTFTLDWVTDGAVFRQTLPLRSLCILPIP